MGPGDNRPRLIDAGAFEKVKLRPLHTDSKYMGRNYLGQE